MKNRWKFNENSSKIELGGVLALLGPLGVTYWRPWASWEHLGSLFRASWSVTGRPGGIPEPAGDPTWTPGRAQNRPKIDPKSHWFFVRILDAMLIPKWSQNGSPNLPKALQKSVSFFDRFFHRCLDRSWGPKSLKMSTSYTREAHCHKVAFSDSDIFLEAKIMKTNSQNGTNMA